MLNRFVVAGLIACSMVATTVFGQDSGDAKPADAGQAASPPATATKAPAGLKDAYAGKFLIGTANDLGNLSEAEQANIKANYNVITPENCMKPQPTHPSEDRYNWSTPRPNGQMVRGQSHQGLGPYPGLAWADWPLVLRAGRRWQAGDARTGDGASEEPYLDGGGALQRTPHGLGRCQ